MRRDGGGEQQNIIYHRQDTLKSDLVATDSFVSLWSERVLLFEPPSHFYLHPLTRSSLKNGGNLSIHI
ncbi:hypothetical protein P8452_67705 [Trifolium repens]|nr:hypothetical protein P8452_67705 [Trifolium repens]